MNPLIKSALYFFILLFTSFTLAKKPQALIYPHKLTGNESHIRCEIDYLDFINFHELNDTLFIELPTDTQIHKISLVDSRIRDLFTPFGLNIPLNSTIHRQHLQVALNINGEGLLKFEGQFYYLFNCISSSYVFSLDFNPTHN